MWNFFGMVIGASVVAGAIVATNYKPTDERFYLQGSGEWVYKIDRRTGQAWRLKNGYPRFTVVNTKTDK